MKKSTKSLWIYAAVLFLIAIGLILLTTLTQARLVNHDGNFEVLGTLNENAQKNVSRLTEENIALQGELSTLKNENETLKAELDSAHVTATASETLLNTVASLYSARQAEDYESLDSLLSGVTKEQLEPYLPGFYDQAQEDVADYKAKASRNKR